MRAGGVPHFPPVYAPAPEHAPSFSSFSRSKTNLWKQFAVIKAFSGIKSKLAASFDLLRVQGIKFNLVIE